MIKKITMLKDGDCTYCAEMEIVMKEYCAAKTDVDGKKKQVWDFKVIDKENIPTAFRPAAYPAWLLYCDQTHSVFEIPVVNPKNFITLHNIYLTNTYL
tara:strand:+ start:1875 stop:2168 length:294 start_codon:yes stop_codon:yes gene_type:complete